MRLAPILLRLALSGALGLAGCSAEPIPPSPPSIPVIGTPPVEAPPTATPRSVPAPSTDSPEVVAVGHEQLACRGTDVTFSSRKVFPAGDAELGSDPPAAALRATIAGQGPGDSTFPARGWTIVAAGPASVTYVADAAGHWAVVTVAVDATGAWVFLEGGACDLTLALPAGIGFASWRLDPAHPPDPAASHVALLATELACAGGQPPGGRLLAPIVEDTPVAVLIGLQVATKPGGSDCPGNPEFHADVQLSTDLGDRTLFDLSSFPPQLRT
jgi:hypothetical protein